MAVSHQSRIGHPARPHSPSSTQIPPVVTGRLNLPGALGRPAVQVDAGYWRLRLIAWIHTALGAVAVIPWNPKRQTNRSCLPPTWSADELGKRAAIERF